MCCCFQPDSCRNIFRADSINWSKVSIWDSLIAETALENGIVKIYTENLKDFKKIPGLKVVNPMEE